MDIARLRAETPGTAHCLNLNNAGASLMPLPVIEILQDYLKREIEIGGQGAALEWADALAAIPGSIAALINATPGSIALTTNATRAWQLAFYGLSFAEGDRILTSRAEYGSNYVGLLQMRKRTSCVIEVIPDDAYGASDPRALEAMLDERVKLIALTWVPTNGGLVNPVAAFGKIARANHIPYLLDACQAVGQMSVDVAELACDFLCATGRKWLRGPRGSGFLYVAPAMLERVEPAMIDHSGAHWRDKDAYELASDAGRYQTYERAYGAALGLGAAVDYALSLGLDEIQSRINGLAARLRQELAGRPGFAVHDLGAEKCGIVTFTHETMASSDIRDGLAQAGMQVSVSPPEGTLLDATERGLGNLVRASPHYYNTDDELDQVLRKLDALAAAV